MTGANVRESTLGQVPAAANAATLEGSSLAQVRSGIDATALGGTPRSRFYDSSEVDERLPRAAEKRSLAEQTFNASTPIDRISVDLAAPRDGFALVIGSGVVHPNTGVTAAHTCLVELSVPEIPQVGRFAGYTGGETSAAYETITQSWIVPVSAGTHTFTLHLSINPFVSVSCTDAFASSSSSLNAVFLPYGPSGP